MSLGLGWRVLQLEQERRQPLANLPSLELPATTRSTTPPSLTLERDGLPIRLVLAPSENCPSYQAELSRAGNGARVVLEDLRRDPFGLLTFLMPAPAGDYELRLNGCGKELQKSTFRVAVKPEGNDG